MTAAESIPWCIAFAVVAVLIICGNLLTILVLTRSSLINNNLCVLLICLAVADLTVGTLPVPLYLYHIIASQGNRESVVTAAIYQSIDIFTAFASIFSLIVIAIERLLAITTPVRHQRVSRLTYIKIIAIVWGLAAILGCLAALKNVRVIAIDSFFVPVITCFFASTVILCVSYLFIWLSARKIIIEEGRDAREQEKRLGVTLLIVTSLFLLMWFPFQIMNLMFFSGVKCGLHCTFEVITFFKLLHYGNSFVNPIIYTFRVPGFKKAALRLLRRENLASITEEDITLNIMTGPATEA